MSMPHDKQKKAFEEYEQFLDAVVNFQSWLEANTPDTPARDQAVLKITDARLWAAEAISKGIKV